MRPDQVQPLLLAGRIGRAGRRLGVGSQGPGQVVGLDRVAASEDHQPLDEVLQLPHVARPGIIHQGIEGVLGQRRPFDARRAGIAAQEIVDEQRDVVGRSRSGGSCKVTTFKRW